MPAAHFAHATLRAPANSTLSAHTEQLAVLVMLGHAPSWLALLLPQHRTSPLRNKAHVWSPYALNWATPVNESTVGGVVTLAVNPFPSWPWVFRPQHRTPPPTPTRAHVWVKPHTT